ncbi:MAG: hypothetical protein A2X49_04450 [Lentisphaerae bacterium GWF2_52_8]|nr:MAG: hypothetical protein A2X49_04450 [Lentisphaerae bacterium GWF2_52_8]
MCFANTASAKTLDSCVSKLKIAVLKGGTSSEREVSLESGAAVAKALREAGCEVVEIDIREPKISQEMRSANAVFPVLHGGFGESGELQKVLEDANLKFVGCGSEACGIIIDKLKSKKFMEKHGIPTPPYAMLTKNERAFPSKLKLPVVVKPPSEGSTVGISLVSTMEEWDKAIDECLKYDKTVLVEEYVEGDEITVGILLGQALPPVEIKYPGKMYDYDAKYTHAKGETFYHCPPKNVSEELQKKAGEIAVKFFEATGARDLLRVDMIVARDGKIYVLEGNNLPGFTSSSLLPKAAKTAGISFVQLCASLALSATQRG